MKQNLGQKLDSEGVGWKTRVRLASLPNNQTNPRKKLSLDLKLDTFFAFYLQSKKKELMMFLQSFFLSS
jgi:hypothetical protein